MIDRRTQNAAAPSPSPHDDPLAELARIVSEGEGQPYRDPNNQNSAQYHGQYQDQNPVQYQDHYHGQYPDQGEAQAPAQYVPDTTPDPASMQAAPDFEADLFDEVRTAYDERVAQAGYAGQKPDHPAYAPDPYGHNTQQGYEPDPAYYEQAEYQQPTAYTDSQVYHDPYQEQTAGQGAGYAPAVTPKEPDVYGEYGAEAAYQPVDLDMAMAQNQPQAQSDLAVSSAAAQDMQAGHADERAGVLPPHSKSILRSIPGSQEGGRKALYAAAAVLGVLVIGIGGVFAYRSIGDGGASSPPIIKADTSPVKTIPDDPGGKEIPHQNKAIYDRVGGDDPQTERLVSSEEQPLNVQGANAGGQRTVSRVISLSGDQTGPGSNELLPGIQPNSRAGVSTAGDRIGPKKVRTVIVKPDGTIVGNAPSQPRSVSTTLIPSVTLPSSTSPANQQAQPNTVTASLPVDGTTAAANELLGQLNDNGVVEAAIGTPANVPIPLPRPTPPASIVTANVQTSQPADSSPSNPSTTNLASSKARQVAITSAPLPELSRPATGSGLVSGFVVQVSSQRSESLARAAYADLQRRFPSLLAVQPVHIQPADLGDRGVYYRAGAGPMPTRAEAARFCENLKAAGADCLVRRVQ